MVKKVVKTAKSDGVKAKSVAVSTQDRYIETVGRRKTAVARVRVFVSPSKKSGSYDIHVNGKPLSSYFPLARQHHLVTSPLSASGESHRIVARVNGGGVEAQAEAIRLGIARAIVATNIELKSKLKALGYLKRDPRMVERKKFGSRKARRPQQWRKR